MGRAVLLLVVMATIGVAAAPEVAAEILPVPPAVRQLREPQEETHVLRTRAGLVIGEQHSRAVVAGDRLTFDIATRFTSGEEWDEHGEMDLADGFRARRFEKVARRSGGVFEKQQVDFTTGKVEWLVDGVHAERTLAFAPDTYIGPMLAMILGSVPEKSPATSTFQALVFRPDPGIFTLRADAVDQEDMRIGNVAEPTTKLRVKADLGPLQNVMFASLIPTHYFWFSRATPAEFVAFDGALGNGVEVTMLPDAAGATKTARAE
jgi:hypothetical protein